MSNEKKDFTQLRDSQDLPQRFEILSHENGSITLVDAENGQAMHSRIGPEQEARWVYADRACIENALSTLEAEHVLYDVGMGTAANVIAVLNRIQSSLQRPKGTLKVFSFESKPQGLATALDSIECFPLLAPWKEQLSLLLRERSVQFRLGHVEVEWSLLIGDFYSLLDEALAPDSIFFDFYSPKVVPELWSRERFELLRSRIGDQACALYTYSASTPVRLNLLLAGFFVGEGVSTGIKNQTTIAHTRFEALSDPLTPKWLRKLDSSTSIANLPSKDEVRSHPQWGMGLTQD